MTTFADVKVLYTEIDTLNKGLSLLLLCTDGTVKAKMVSFDVVSLDTLTKEIEKIREFIDAHS